MRRGGEDITFDLGIIERFGCYVVAFDPTPRAIAHVAEHAADEPRFTFRPVGLWSEDTSLRFFAPRDPAHVSHSAVNLQRTETYFEAEVRTLPTLMHELGHDRIDLLKLDIEGAEHGVTRVVPRGRHPPDRRCASRWISRSGRGRSGGRSGASGRPATRSSRSTAGT